MRKKTVTILTGLLTLLTVSSALAFEQQGVKKDKIEVAVHASEYNVNPDGGSSSGYLMIGGTVGYFFADPMEVGLDLTIMDYDDSSSYIFRPFFRYHFFPTPTIIPYAGAGLPYMDTEGVDSGLGINIHGGVDFFLMENLALAPELALDLFNDSDMFTIMLQLKAFFSI